MRCLQSAALTLLALALVEVGDSDLSAEVMGYSVTGTIDVNQNTTDFYPGIPIGAPFTGFFIYDDAIEGDEIGGGSFDVYRFVHPSAILGVSFTVAGQTFQGDPNADVYAPVLFDDFQVGPFPAEDTISYEQPAVPLSGHEETAFKIRAEFSGPDTAIEFGEGDPVFLPPSMLLSDWTSRKAIEFGMLTEQGALSQKLGGTIQTMELISFGDYNFDGVVDAVDADLQSLAMKDPDPELSLYDENNDGFLDFADRLIWAHDHAEVWIGDSNLDGQFNSGDFVSVFTAGKYETGEMAGWAEGDWDGDMLFDSGDFVVAFTDGGYELGSRPTAMVVPEPSGILLASTLLAGCITLLRRSNASNIEP